MAGGRAAALLLAAAGTSLLGCETAGSHPALHTVVLDVRFSRFSPSTVTVPPGAVVRFVVRNHDPIPHELIIGDQAVQDRHEHGTEAHHGERPGEVSVAAGATAVTTYPFGDGGRILFGCHLPGHWSYGMRGAIHVE